MRTAWLSQSALRCLGEEADRHYPLETGGVLAGYFAENGEAVIVGAIGPGPLAIHKRLRFLPDHDWQCTQLNMLFEQTGGDLIYLGDWHTHPDASGRMSWLDHRTLRAIAKHPHARVTNPLMLIGGGAAGAWKWRCHRYCGDRLLGLLIDCEDGALRVFESAA